METPQDLLTHPPLFKMYKESHIGVATFFGGPLVGGYLAAENFKNLGDSRSARNAWIISVAATIIIFGCILFIPGIEHLPSYLIPLIYSTITRFFVQKYQGNSIKAHALEGGQYYSGWRATAVSLIGAALLFVVLFTYIYLSGLAAAK